MGYLDAFYSEHSITEEFDKVVLACLAEYTICDRIGGYGVVYSDAVKHTLGEGRNVKMMLFINNLLPSADYEDLCIGDEYFKIIGFKGCEDAMNELADYMVTRMIDGYADEGLTGDDCLEDYGSWEKIWEMGLGD